MKIKKGFLRSRWIEFRTRRNFNRLKRAFPEKTFELRVSKTYRTSFGKWWEAVLFADGVRVDSHYYPGTPVPIVNTLLRRYCDAALARKARESGMPLATSEFIYR